MFAVCGWLFCVLRSVVEVCRLSFVYFAVCCLLCVAVRSLMLVVFL